MTLYLKGRFTVLLINGLRFTVGCDFHIYVIGEIVSVILQNRELKCLKLSTSLPSINPRLHKPRHQCLKMTTKRNFPQLREINYKKGISNFMNIMWQYCTIQTLEGSLVHNLHFFFVFSTSYIVPIFFSIYSHCIFTIFIYCTFHHQDL